MKINYFCLCTIELMQNRFVDSRLVDKREIAFYAQACVKVLQWDRRQPAPPRCRWHHLTLRRGLASAGLRNKNVLGLRISSSQIPLCKLRSTNQEVKRLTLIVDGL